MPLIQIPVGVAPCQVDFPEKLGKGESAKPLERSCKGAMHIRPASTKVMTQDEFDFLTDARGLHYKTLGCRLLVVKVDVVPDTSDRPRAMTKEDAAKSAASPSAPTPTPDPPTPPPAAEPSSSESEPSSSESTGSRSRRRGGRG